VALHLLLRHSEGELLEQVALKHATRPISRDMYCAFEEVLLKTVETTDTKIIAATAAERTRLLTAWTTALRDGMNYMKEHGVGGKNRGMECSLTMPHPGPNIPVELKAPSHPGRHSTRSSPI
jgi:hypothetical protein